VARQSDRQCCSLSRATIIHKDFSNKSLSGWVVFAFFCSAAFIINAVINKGTKRGRIIQLDSTGKSTWGRGRGNPAYQYDPRSVSLQDLLNKAGAFFDQDGVDLATCPDIPNVLAE
jgi:hypothetical protein